MVWHSGSTWYMEHVSVYVRFAVNCDEQLNLVDEGISYHSHPVPRPLASPFTRAQLSPRSVFMRFFTHTHSLIYCSGHVTSNKI